MTVKWLAGNRIEGTSADRTTGTPAIPAVSGGWKEVGRTTLGSAGDDIDVTSIPDKRYYHILVSQLPTGSAVGKLTLNNSGSTYTRRFSVNGASDTAQSSLSEIGLTTTETNPNFQSIYLANLSSKEKLGLVHNVRQNTAGAGNAPNRAEQVFKWTNTSDAINRVDVYNSSTGSFNTNSEVVVLGYDPDDTHTDNFWEELADVSLSSASDTLSSGTITAKKYLWVQTYVKATGGTVEPDSRFNNDNSGTNNVSGTYADRYNINGGSDATGTSLNKGVRGSGVPVSAFFNDFIINNASNEKLVIRHVNYVSTAGLNVPNRRETVGKWSNTSDQITNITWHDESGSGAQMDSGSFIKVWGSN